MKLQNLSKEIEKIYRKSQDGLESDKSETNQSDQIENKNYLKVWKTQQREMMMI